MKKYKLLVAGGTFDHLHKGHKDFLRFQASLSEKILLGITSDEYVRERKQIQAEPFVTRTKAVEDFLKAQQLDGQFVISPIDDPGIPSSLQDAPIEAIAVTPATQKGAQAINQNRKERGLNELVVEICPLTLAVDNKPISSTRIRQGEILRDGTVCLPDAVLIHTFELPSDLRDELKKPFGDVIRSDVFDYASMPMEKVITVGDVAAQTFLTRQLHPRIAVVDFVVEREKHYEKPEDLGFIGGEKVLHVTNPAGMITKELLAAIKGVFTDSPQKNTVLIVAGEEDLAVIPVILAAPLGRHIFYGQPGEGLVHVPVTEEKKAFALKLLQQFRIV